MFVPSQNNDVVFGGQPFFCDHLGLNIIYGTGTGDLSLQCLNFFPKIWFSITTPHGDMPKAVV